MDWGMEEKQERSHSKPPKVAWSRDSTFSNADTCDRSESFPSLNCWPFSAVTCFNNTRPTAQDVGETDLRVFLPAGWPK